MSDAFYAPKRAMVIVAHPDDIEFGCAGTVARWVKAGAEVCYVLCTSGDVGIAKPELTRAQVTEIREAEQLAAAEKAGLTIIGEATRDPYLYISHNGTTLIDSPIDQLKPLWKGGLVKYY